MSQRRSPAVRYPLRHSRVLQRVWWLAVTAGAAALLLWWWQGAGVGVERVWRVLASALLWLLCTTLSWQALRLQPQGFLYWDGQGWSWQVDGLEHALPGGLAVVLDLQSLLVLRGVVQEHGVQYWMVQRAWTPHLWPDLRRAVYS